MSENQQLLADTSERLFADLEVVGEPSFDQIWAQVEHMQLSGLLLPEEAGGFGGDWEDFFTVVRLAGFFGIAAPLGEAIIARYATHKSSWSSKDGLHVIAPSASGELDEKNCYTGEVRQIPWGRNAETVIVELNNCTMRLKKSDAATVEEGLNPAGEARDSFIFDSAPAEITQDKGCISSFGALLRTAQIAGALDRTLGLSIEHANDRQQFGRPIAKFQAVQQNLAILAEEAAAANSAGRAAALAAICLDDAEFEIKAAKIRANMAAGAGTTIGHQTHGAIGFTKEHRLQHFTRRLISWRSEFGGDASVAERLGCEVLEHGAENFWAHLTMRSDQIGDKCNTQ